jgi:hypothetical protein
VYPRGAEMHAFYIDVFCWDLDWQVSSFAQIFNSFSQMFSSVEDLTLKHKEHSRSSEEVDRTEWRKLFRSFSNVKTLRIAKGLVGELSRCLQLEDGELPLGLLPELQELTYTGSANTFTSFTDARQNAGRPVILDRRSPSPEPSPSSVPPVETSSTSTPVKNGGAQMRRCRAEKGKRESGRRNGAALGPNLNTFHLCITCSQMLDRARYDRLLDALDTLSTLQLCLQHPCLTRLTLRHALPSHSMSTRQFYCDCPARCKRRKLVSKTTYYDHAKFRPRPQLESGLHSDYNTFAALRGVPASSSSNPISSNHELHGPQSRQRSVGVSEEDESDNEGSSSARTLDLVAHASGQVDQAVGGGWGSSNGPEGDEGRLIHHGSCS